jgi:transcriptional regulator with XRE-family HTH domain
MTVGERIKSLREKQGMTLEELGNKVGVGAVGMVFEHPAPASRLCSRGIISSLCHIVT